MKYPRLIQGGMGVAVSSWPLARAVSMRGQLGVVSGTALDTVLSRRLQLGDLGGHLRNAFDHFPIREVAERIWERYFVAGGKAPDAPFKSKPVPSINPSQSVLELTVLANFVEVFLAKHGHDGIVGINLLEKIQLPTLPSLFGALLAGVDFVLMGAGIPRAIPAALDSLSLMEPTELRIDVAGALPGENFVLRFDPRPYCSAVDAPLKRPEFLAIVSSAALAQSLAKKSTGKVNGFVIEGWTAGGHNAPPRGKVELNERGEPIYGPRDVPDLQSFRDLGLPFWLAGSYGDASKVQEAIAAGAQGVQVGTAFAFCEESGLDPAIKARVIEMSLRGECSVRTDPLASPTGFPFKVLSLSGTVSQEDEYQARCRVCDLGYLREPYRLPDGKVGYRCASEPLDDFVRKGGSLEQTVGRKCVCNGLLATVGMPQRQKSGQVELPLVTAGDDVANVAKFLKPGQTSYTANDVIELLLGADA